MATEQTALSGNRPRLSTAGAIGVVAVPVLLAIAVYQQFAGLWFWTDDFLWLSVAADLGFGEAVKEAFEYPRGASPYWRPLVDLYFYGMYRAFGLSGTPFHVVTLAFHTGAGILLGLLAFRLTRSELTGMLAAGLFVVSPTYSAMVPWATGITAAMSGFFSVAMALCFLEWLRGRRYVWLALAGAAMAAALLSKEDAAALPAVLVIMTLALRPPSDLRGLRDAGLLVLPLIALWTAYALPQITNVVGSDGEGQFEIGWHAVPRLGIALSWISLPWPLWYAEWVAEARWAALGVFTSAAVLSAWRRAWLLPALYLSAVVMLLPSSFLDTTFAHRWTYHASLPWAIFIAVLLSSGYERLSAISRPGALAVGGALTFSLIAVLSARTIESQNWVPLHSDEYQAIEAAVRDGCTGPSEGSRIYLFELPARGPGYAVPRMLNLVRPGATLHPMRPQQLLSVPPPEQGDCTLAWGWYETYVAQTVEAGREGFALWSPPDGENLLAAANATPAPQTRLTETADGLRVTSSESEYGVLLGKSAPVENLTYVGSAMVRIDGASGPMDVTVALRQETTSAATFELTTEWQRVAVYHPAALRKPSPLSLELTVRAGGQGQTSFLVKDAELKLFAVQSPLN
ncbi:MAG: hypothetical protein WD939_10145 [Dehalococcoidia bacterium]